MCICKICSYIKDFVLFLLGTYVYIFSVSTYIVRIPKSVVSVPNFSLVCLVVYFHLLKGHIGVTLTLGTLHLESSVQSFLIFLIFSFCVFPDLATSKLSCPWFSTLKSSFLNYSFVFLCVSFQVIILYLNSYYCHFKLSTGCPI